MNAKIGFLAATIVTIIIGVYGVELGIRVSTGSGKPEYLTVVLIVLAMLTLTDILLYRRLHSIKTDLQY